MTEEEKKAMLSEMERDQQGGSKKFWTLPSKFEGTKVIRILPPLKKKGEKKFYFQHAVNWIGGVPYEALDQTVYDSNGNLLHEAQQDPVVKFCKQIFRNGTRGSDDWKLAQELNSKTRYISRIIVRNPEDRQSELQPVFFEYGPTIFNILYHIMTETDFGIIVDPKEGRDFHLTKAGTGRQSKYETSTPAANVSSIFSDADALKQMFQNAMKMDYTDNIEFVSYDQKKNALYEYLGYETKTQEHFEQNPASSNTEKDNYTQAGPPVDTSTEEVDTNEDDDEDDDIQQILDEFAE